MTGRGPVLWLGALGLAALGVAIARGGHAGKIAAGYGRTHVVGDRFPKTLLSQDGSREIPRPPRRIASLTVTADEVLVRLAAPDRLVAVTHFADDPAIETTAGLAPPGAARVRGADPERVISLEPDLVFVAHYTLESAVRLVTSARVPVVRLLPVQSFADVEENAGLIARATGDEPAGTALVARFRERLARVEGAVAGRRRPRVLYYSAVGYTSGAATLVDAKLRAAGGLNVVALAGVSGFQSVSLDLLVGLDPDVIVVPRWSPDAAAAIRTVTETAAFRDTSAVRGGRVHALPASALTSESPDGVSGVEALARIFHPEAFPS